jgi:hypothetical protein
MLATAVYQSKTLFYGRKLFRDLAPPSPWASLLKMF